MYIFCGVKPLCDFYEFSLDKFKRLQRDGLIQEVEIKRRRGSKDKKGYVLVIPTVRYLLNKIPD